MYLRVVHKVKINTIQRIVCKTIRDKSVFETPTYLKPRYWQVVRVEKLHVIIALQGSCTNHPK